MKKKHSATNKDKKDWLNFIKDSKNLYDKDKFLFDGDIKKTEIKKIDLHGFSLDEANQEVKKFINKSYEDGIARLIIVTGKGSRSKVYSDPYRSKKMSVLKHSVPEYIKNNKELLSKINSIEVADIKYGGAGALYIVLKKFKE